MLLRMTDEGIWWTRGTALAERLTPGHAAPCPPVAAGPGTEGEGDPLAGWRSDYPSAEAFRARLQRSGTDEAVLRGLLAEPPGELAARIGRPSWAAAAERAWAAAPPDPPARQPGASWQDGFAAILAPFAAGAAADLLDAAQAADAGAVADLVAVRDSFARQLTVSLVALARRTLVLELNVARVAGRLAGATPEERFADFVRRCSSRKGLRALLTGYPVLARLLGQAAGQGTAAWTELLARLAADRAAVAGTFFGGADPGPLTEVVFGAGDRHQGGRSVAVLRFAGGGRVVLKPRPVAVHAHFNTAVEWLNSRLPGLGLRTLRVLERPGYGWVEYAPAAPCADRAQVARFYRRVGALLALLHALGGTDMHVENLIACADQPVPVDLETLLHPVPARPSAGDPARAALEGSVRRTALLPSFVVGERGAVDISGLGGDRGAALPVEIPGWSAPATDEMRLVRTTGVFPGAANRPRLSDADADPGDHTEDLVAGFHAGYDVIAEHRADLTGPDGLLALFAEDGTRAVVRNTRWYAALLDESTHPDVLRDALDRDRLLDVLWRESESDPVLRALVPAELAELWAGDVPLISCRPASDELTVGRRTLRGLVRRTGLRDAEERLAAMGGADRRNQEWVLRACLATRRPAAPDAAPGGGTGAPFARAAAVAADPERLLAAACGIADLVAAAAHEADGRANWLGVEPLEDRLWAVLPQGAGLPHGYLGTALFLAELGDLTGTGRYSALARRALAPVPGLLAALAAHPADLPTIGTGFAGLGGIAYALTRLAVLLADRDIAGWAAESVELAAPAAEPDGPLGVLEGDAGCLAAMLAVRQATGSDRAAAVARACADRLAALPAAALPAGGLDTGASGIGWALLRYAAEAGGSARHAAAGRAALLAACTRYAAAPVGAGWCDGPTGVALALADLAAHRAGPVATAPGGEAARAGAAVPRLRPPATAPAPATGGAAARAVNGSTQTATANGSAATATASGSATTTLPAGPATRPYPADGPEAPGPALPGSAAGRVPDPTAGSGQAPGPLGEALPPRSGPLPVLSTLPAPCVGHGLPERVTAAAAAGGGQRWDHSLGHGETGALDFLLTAVAAGWADAGAPYPRAGALLAELDRFGPRCGTPDAVNSPGLLTGLAGIGHGLLRLGFGARVPSVLLLRWPGQDRGGGPPPW